MSQTTLARSGPSGPIPASATAPATEEPSGIDRLTTAIQDDPGKAVARFTAHSRQISGLHSEVQLRDFLLSVDEPPALGGTDLGPNPVELVLAAIAACQEVTYRVYADRLGVPLRGVSVSVDGDLDLRGFLAADAGVRPGFTGLEISAELDSDASPEALAALKRTVDAHCPVLDIVRNPTPVSTRLRAGEPAGTAELARSG